jgi:large conductance mechanosensitive channel
LTVIPPNGTIAPYYLRRMTMLKEFKAFIMKGNVMDLAVAVIIGGAFGKIVSSVVSDLIMPVIGLIIGGIDFSGLSLTVGKAKITYGNFINNVIDFLIIALVIFLLVKGVGSLKKKPAPAEPVTKECPYCYTTISIKASRCPNCTSELTRAINLN